VTATSTLVILPLVDYMQLGIYAAYDRQCTRK
jgi:hypothetical protein